MAQSTYSNPKIKPKQYILNVVEQLKGLSVHDSKNILYEAKKYIEEETKV
ncbi:hypothetical protein [Winogradskyella ludwigii]|nr:hypothetical protein [Winogradskyella ludwigii]